jgi:mannose-6-phosphate isomerase-like protein (cupin superfamily)
MEEFYFVVAGVGRMRIDDQTVTLQLNIASGPLLM